jgi:hypothetical protein
MAYEGEKLPWDYFLTEYERDLLQLLIEDAMRKYPSISQEQMESDLIRIQENQATFEQDNGQN